MKIRDTIEDLIDAGLEKDQLTLEEKGNFQLIDNTTKRIVGSYKGCIFSLEGNDNREYLTLRINSGINEAITLRDGFTHYMDEKPCFRYVEEGQIVYEWDLHPQQLERALKKRKVKNLKDLRENYPEVLS